MQIENSSFTGKLLTSFKFKLKGKYEIFKFPWSGERFRNNQILKRNIIKPSFLSLGFWESRLQILQTTDIGPVDTDLYLKFLTYQSDLV